MAEKPECRQHNFSQMDYYNACECGRCKAINEKYGTAGGTQYWFLNQLAARTSRQFPNKLIGTLAYVYRRAAQGPEDAPERRRLAVSHVPELRQPLHCRLSLECRLQATGPVVVEALLASVRLALCCRLSPTCTLRSPIWVDWPRTSGSTAISARITVLSPGQSPPPVTMPIFWFISLGRASVA